MVTVLMVLGGWVLLSCAVSALVCAVATAEKAAPGRRDGVPFEGRPGVSAA